MGEKQVRSIVLADARVNCWVGAVRSGKTIASLLRWLMFVATAPRGGALVVVGRTRESVYRNLFSPLMDPTLFGPLARMVTYTAGAPTGMILGRRIDVLGASDARAEMVLRGLTVAGAYVDEATLVAEPFWMQLLARMSVPGAQLFATTNPDGPAHWFKTKVIDQAGLNGYRVFHFTMDDNPSLLPEYVNALKREYVGLWYRRFILGEWVQADGAIYDMWDTARHVIRHEDLPDIQSVMALGIDHGTSNATRGLLVGLGRRAGERTKMFALDEWAPPTGRTDGEQSAMLRQWLDTRHPQHWCRPEWLFVDPAALSFKTQLFRDGFSNVTNGANAVLPGIRTVASLLATDSLQVSDRCPRLIQQLPGYAWDKKATAKGEDRPLKVDDHEVDALRYAVYSSRMLWTDLVPINPAAEVAPGADNFARLAA